VGMPVRGEQHHPCPPEWRVDVAEISGFCDQQFAPLRAELHRQLDSGAELGASLAVTVAGVPVVDLWGGWSDVIRTQPWGATRSPAYSEPRRRLPRSRR
jgi:hypothetical protein